MDPRRDRDGKALEARPAFQALRQGADELEGIVMEPKIAVIGLGRAGFGLALLLRRAGYEIAAVSGRNAGIMAERSRLLGAAAFPADQNARAASLAGCVFITVPDDDIEQVCRQIAAAGGLAKGAMVFHSSGAGGLSLLEAARQQGCRVGCLHPVHSFAGLAEPDARGVAFGVTAADEGMRQWAFAAVRRMGGVPIDLPEEAKPLFHAAACAASNYLVSLLYLVEALYGACGLQAEAARGVWLPLLRGTLANVEKKGAAEALTGPICRGDAGTVSLHLKALRTRLPDLLFPYAALGLLTLEVARKRGLSPEKDAVLKTILQKEALWNG